jgi:hypothetical protein
MLAIYRLVSAAIVGLAGFVFMVFSALITIRFFVLILLMIGSPIAFIAMAIPTIDFGKTWWDWLIQQSFFAPAMMLMLYLTLYLGKSMRESDLFTGGNLAEAVVSPGGNIDVLVFFATLIGLLLASLIVARRMGAVGADKAIGASSAVYAWTGRQTVGRAGRKVANSQALKEAESSGGFSGYLAQQGRRAREATAQSSFDVRNTGFAETVDREEGQLDSSLGQRDGGINEVIDEQEEFRQGRMESIEELGPQEKREVEKAKRNRDAADEEIGDVNEDLNEIRSAINRRDKLQNKIRETDDSDYQDSLEDQLATLYEDTQEKLNRDLETDIDISNEESMEDAKNELGDTKEQLKDIKNDYEEQVKVGEKRAQEYIKTMEESTSVLDSFGTEYTVDTKGRRQFAFNNQDKLDKGEFQKNIENEINVSTDEHTLEGIPRPPRSYSNKLSEALDEAADNLETKLDEGTDEAIDDINEYLDTAESSPYVRGGDGSGNIEYQNRNEAGQFQQKQSSSPEEMAQRKIREDSTLENPDNDVT